MLHQTATAAELAAAGETARRAAPLVRDAAAQTWGNARTLLDHYIRHGAGVGASSPKDYAARASEFLQGSQSLSLPTKVDASGVIRVYDQARNLFGSFNPDGTTRTFFSPNPAIHGYASNLAYWIEQPGAPPWTP